MTQKNFDKMLAKVEFKLNDKQRFKIFKEIYFTYGVEIMVKMEKLMLTEIKGSSHILPKVESKKVKAACDVILKSLKTIIN
jgi:hypothetical protein